MQPDYFAIGKRLQEARKAKQMTQQQLANIMGVSVSYIKSTERGSKPSLQYLFTVAEHCEVSFDWLLIGVPNITINENNKVEAIFDPDLKMIIDVITGLLHNPDPNMRGWAIVQFKEAFEKYWMIEAEKKDHA